ncbi:hypothetical protein PILCRDRAFT_721551 [Piloderma croceum F 1598]|uniref:Uncharacterized protein n=1 Tax=Piloderma croceum (strain F 1598) TaxID=765440 RepID=A0A0C3B8T1_PILCF|nr:hypothetical protein PILCRDRAFT_721551 [Piloderma croceum F 1598]
MPLLSLCILIDRVGMSLASRSHTIESRSVIEPHVRIGVFEDNQIVEVSHDFFWARPDYLFVYASTCYVFPALLSVQRMLVEKGGFIILNYNDRQSGAAHAIHGHNEFSWSHKSLGLDQPPTTGPSNSAGVGRRSDSDENGIRRACAVGHSIVFEPRPLHWQRKKAESRPVIFVGPIGLCKQKQHLQAAWDSGKIYSPSMKA